MRWRKNKWLPSNRRLYPRWWLRRQIERHWRHPEPEGQVILSVYHEVDIDWKWIIENQKVDSWRHRLFSEKCFYEWSAWQKVCSSCSSRTLWLPESAHFLLHKYFHSCHIPWAKGWDWLSFLMLCQWLCMPVVSKMQRKKSQKLQRYPSVNKRLEMYACFPRIRSWLDFLMDYIKKGKRL